MAVGAGRVRLVTALGNGLAMIGLYQLVRSVVRTILSRFKAIEASSGSSKQLPLPGCPSTSQSDNAVSPATQVLIDSMHSASQKFLSPKIILLRISIRQLIALKCGVGRFEELVASGALP